MEAGGCEFPRNAPATCTSPPWGRPHPLRALRLVTQLRQEGFVAETDTVGRSLKAK